MPQACLTDILRQVGHNFIFLMPGAFRGAVLREYVGVLRKIISIFYISVIASILIVLIMAGGPIFKIVSKIIDPGSGDEIASWIQAAGSVLVLPITIGVAAWQTAKAFAFETKLKREDAEQEKRQLASALKAELSSIIYYIDEKNIGQHYSKWAKDVKSFNVSSSAPFLGKSMNYTVVYDNNCERLTRLGAGLSEKIVDVYARIKVDLDNAWNNKIFMAAMSVRDDRERHNIVSSFNHFRENISETVKRINDVIALLDDL